MTDHIAWFEDLSREDIPSVGGKGANLGELTQAGFPVPGGFVVTAEGYLAAMDEAGVRDDLRRGFGEACATADDPAALAAAAEELQARIAEAGAARQPAGRGARGLPPARTRRLPWPCAPRPPPRTPPGPRSPACTRRSPTSSATTPCSTGSSTAGRRSTASGSSPTGPARGLTDEPVDRRRRPGAGRRRPGRGDVHRRPVDRRPGPRRHRGRLRARRGRRRRARSSPTPTCSPRTGPRLISARIGHKTHQLVGPAGGGNQRVEATDDEARRGS